MLEADLERRRVGPEAIVVVLGSDEQRVGDDGVLVTAARSRWARASG
jgi:hypothetical protein